MQKRSIYPSISNDAKWKEYMQQAITDGLMSSADANLITAYLRWKMSDAGISGKRQTKLYQSIKAFRSRCPCSFSELTEISWQNTIVEIRQADYADWTKSDIIGQTKAFLLWCIERGHINLDAKIIQNVRTPKAPKITKTPEELPTIDDIYKMLKHPHCTIEQQALIAVAYWSGMRIGEIFRLNWSDVVFSPQAVTFRIIDTKTKKYRSAPCVEPLPYLTAWRRQYPAPAGLPEGDNPVFITKIPRTKDKYKRMEYGSANMFLRRIQEACGLRHFSWHTFRAANITNSALAGVPDAVIKSIHWGNQNSQMMATYVMISDQAKEQAMFKRAGLKVDEEERKLSTPQNCPSCCALNGPGDQYCRMCGYPLNSQASRSITNIENSLRQSPEYLSALQELIQETVRKEMEKR